MSDSQLPGPPPHPYAASAQVPERRGQALPIAAMALGLVGAVTVFVAPVTFAAFAWVGAALGVVALVLGVIALVRGLRRGPAITGVAAGALAVIAAVIVGALALGGALVGAARQGQQGGQTPDGSGGEVATAVEWPRNMASGGLVFGGADGGLATSAAPEANALPVPRTAAELGTPALIRVYVDYRCPYCALFETANADTLAQVLADGTAAVELTPLTFLDRVSEGSYYSSRAAGALACLADTQPDAAWEANAALMLPDVQPAEGGPGLDNDGIIAAIEDGAGALNAEARACITEERFVPFAQALSDWVFANPVPHAADPELRVTGTPLVVVDGVPYPGDPADPAAFRAFLAQQGIAVD
ncbi:DsbA family protein [Leucobacter chromiireducens]|uniref:DsbA family protein n=1 Tax=Leucobacter chromiireducens TaxID=283877 RepID=UPI0013DE06F0|nr:thioredoxin domain-containing protein [Leucobacter chromiireducens]